jgi:hypothetical protein
MKKQVVHVMLFVLLLCAPVLSQRVEIYGGAQFEHFKHVLGITADFSGVYNSVRTDSSVYTFTAGPVLTARLPVVQPFVHALFGGARISAGGASDTAFAMFLGGGLDIGFRKGIAFRLIQADWLMTKFSDQTQDKQGRVSAGIVIKF